MNRSEPLRIGIIGLGKVSEPHIRGYSGLPGEAGVVAVCDTDREVLQKAASELGAAAYGDYEALLRDPAIDAVVLLLPHLLHHPVALAALRAGKHVALEKPMAVSETQCEELIRVASERGRVLSVSENSRFVESYMEARRLVEEGWTGPVRLVRGFIYGSALKELAAAGEEWKRERHGFAAILDAAPHFFYLLKWMFGPVSSLQAVERRWAQSHGLPDCAAEDGALVSGTLASGGNFSIEIALNAELPWGERFEIYGDDGSLICDQLRDPPMILHRGADDYGTALPTVRADPRGWRNASIGRGAADFVRAVREGRQPAVAAADAAYAVRLAVCAYRSVRSGGRLVQVEA